MERNREVESGSTEGGFYLFGFQNELIFWLFWLLRKCVIEIKMLNAYLWMNDFISVGTLE